MNNIEYFPNPRRRRQKMKIFSFQFYSWSTLIEIERLTGRNMSIKCTICFNLLLAFRLSPTPCRNDHRISCQVFLKPDPPFARGISSPCRFVFKLNGFDSFLLFQLIRRNKIIKPTQQFKYAQTCDSLWCGILLCFSLKYFKRMLWRKRRKINHRLHDTQQWLN